MQDFCFNIFSKHFYEMHNKFSVSYFFSTMQMDNLQHLVKGTSTQNKWVVFHSTLTSFQKKNGFFLHHHCTFFSLVCTILFSTHVQHTKKAWTCFHLNQQKWHHSNIHTLSFIHFILFMYFHFKEPLFCVEWTSLSGNWLRTTIHL